MKAAGTDLLRLHDLRRTFASLLADAGAPMAEVGAALGHAPGSRMTARVYALVDREEAARRSAERMARILGGSP